MLTLNSKPARFFGLPKTTKWATTLKPGMAKLTLPLSPKLKTSKARLQLHSTPVIWDPMTISTSLSRRNSSAKVLASMVMTTTLWTKHGPCRKRTCSRSRSVVGTTQTRAVTTSVVTSMVTWPDSFLPSRLRTSWCSVSLRLTTCPHSFPWSASLKTSTRVTCVQHSTSTVSQAFLPWRFSLLIVATCSMPCMTARLTSSTTLLWRLTCRLSRTSSTSSQKPLSWICLTTSWFRWPVVSPSTRLL